MEKTGAIPKRPRLRPPEERDEKSSSDSDNPQGRSRDIANIRGRRDQSRIERVTLNVPPSTSNPASRSADIGFKESDESSRVISSSLDIGFAEDVVLSEESEDANSLSQKGAYGPIPEKKKKTPKGPPPEGPEDLEEEDPMKTALKGASHKALRAMFDNAAHYFTMTAFKYVKNENKRHIPSQHLFDVLVRDYVHITSLIRDPNARPPRVADILPTRLQRLRAAYFMGLKYAEYGESVVERHTNRERPEEEPERAKIMRSVRIAIQTLFTKCLKTENLRRMKEIEKAENDTLVCITSLPVDDGNDSNEDAPQLEKDPEDEESDDLHLLETHPCRALDEFCAREINLDLFHDVGIDTDPLTEEHEAALSALYLEMEKPLEDRVVDPNRYEMLRRMELEELIIFFREEMRLNSPNPSLYHTETDSDYDEQMITDESESSYGRNYDESKKTDESESSDWRNYDESKKTDESKSGWC